MSVKIKTATRDMYRLSQTIKPVIRKKRAAIPGRPFGKLSEIDITRIAQQYQELVTEHERLNLEIEAATRDLKKRQSTVSKQMDELKALMKDNLEPGMGKVAAVRKGLLKWSIYEKATPPGYLQLIDEAEARMMDVLGSDVGSLAVSILKESSEALKGVALVFKDIQYIANAEDSNTREAGILDALTRMISRLGQLMDRVRNILGLARKRIVQDSDVLLKKLDKLTGLVEEAQDAMP